MKTPTGSASDEAQIRKIVDDRVDAVFAKDLNRLMSDYAPDVVSFDVVNPLTRVGSDEIRRRAGEWFSAYQGPIGYEIRDLVVAAAGDLAFCYYLYRIRGVLTDGGKVDMWVRATVCFRKTRDKWLITHEHGSVPFDPETGRASVDIKP